MEITEEMRKAVLAEECKLYGHKPDYTDVQSVTEKPNPNDPQGLPMMTIKARDPNKLPHVKCLQCDCVWLVIDEPGHSYDEAVANVAARLEKLRPKDTESLTPYAPVGTVDTPIPLAPGVVWEDLPESHPAKEHLRMEEKHAEVHANEKPPPIVEPDPNAPQPEPGSTVVITTEP